MSSCTKDNPRFSLLSADQTGIHFNNEITENDSFNILTNEYMYNGGGVGVGDLNNDGFQDLVFTGNQVSSSVYLNRGNFEFQNIDGSLQNLITGQWHSGVALADVNDDGWLDIYLTSTNSSDPEMRKNCLWINRGIDEEGIPHFMEMAVESGVADEGYSVHAAFLDYDLDGDLDLYVLNNIVSKEIPTNYRPKITDGSAINNDSFYRNLGNGKFENITREAGIVYEGFGLGIGVGDINKDGYPDLYISNDYISNDLLYINQKDGTFRNHSEEYLSYQSKFSMGNDIADINNDGNPDIITLDMLPEKYFRKKQTINGNSYYFYVNDNEYGYQHQYVRNMLQLHNGFNDGHLMPFSEVGQMMGVYQSEWSWSPLFADFDNDGDRDLAVTNGFPKDLTDKDFTNYKAQFHGYVASDEQVIKQIPIVKVSNYIYENNAEAGFADRTSEWGMGIPSFSCGAAFADLDNDGDLDYVVNNIDDPAFIYRNNINSSKETNTNYLKIKLTGNSPNTLALGSKVEIWADGNYQYHEHFLSRGYISSIDPVVHFGLGNINHIDSLRVTWPTPGNLVTEIENIDANQILEINQNGAKSKRGRQFDDRANSLFVAEPEMISYEHSQEDFIDFFLNQRIIPHKFSQLGPCMAQGDLNGDGLDDLLIGASSDLPSSVYVRKDNGFEPTEIEGLTGRKECSESDLVIVDVDGDGDNDVITISGGYEVQNESQYRHFVYLNSGGAFERVELPLPPFIASVVRPCDFDRDGDQDLFVGARVQKDNYPFAGVSYLLINESGTYTVRENLSFDLGMVTDAAWADVDNDGWQDILVGREWNTPVVLKNNNGTEMEEWIPGPLSKLEGLWSGIGVADLDGDGDQDFILGNLGENHRFHISDDYPMQLYAIDIDNNGIVDPVSTAYWKDKDGKMKEYPVNYFDELVSQSPFFRDRFDSYTEFSYTPFGDIVDKTTIGSDYIFSINTTSSYILWNDGDRLSLEKLPRSLQVSPIKKFLIRDFNGDEIPDALIAGNDHSYDVSTGYYDANKGFILLGDRGRKLEVLTPKDTGLLLEGQVEALHYFDGETPLVIAGINRKKLAVYKHNRK